MASSTPMQLIHRTESNAQCTAQRHPAVLCAWPAQVRRALQADTLAVRGALQRDTALVCRLSISSV